ncbi:alpha/beta fold hydrolase [Streptomyces sp. NPDC005648]|uniref:alpha/beta fold hydrolase n=1 Tax=Streptomyces sp. NPDC005648 TaxID=3157044 RepID=UPI0033A279DD
MTEQLHYDVRGNGPVLLIVPGGAGHPMGLGPVTEALADRFTVVTHDPLGLGHGRLGQPVADQRPQDWSDGAARVLDEVLPEGESAYVLGISAGGIAALDLLVRHPQRLRHIVAHEPPCVGVLPDGAHQQAKFLEVYDTYRAAGLEAAGDRMSAFLAGQEPREQAVTQPPAPDEELNIPMAIFLTRVLPHFTRYTPAPDALAASPARLTLAAGADSRGQLLHRTAVFLAEHSKSSFVELPGGHLGVMEHPVAYAERLARTLAPLDDPGAPLAR